jgi:twinkle protein
MGDLPLGPAGVDFLEGRKIDPEIAGRYGVHTCTFGPDRRPVPSRDGTVLAFPFKDRDAVVNTKYRGITNKRFWQTPGGKKTFYNVDAFDDVAVTRGDAAVVICEGELDCLAAITAGHPWTVSVPDGAPPPAAPGSHQDQSDETGKFAFMWNNRERLARVHRFVLAIDADAAGERLSDELVRRLLASRCAVPIYPLDCKDINDVLKAHGATAVLNIINGARPLPIAGIFGIDDYPERDFATWSSGIGHGLLDAHFKLFPGQFIVMSGIPSHGKTSLATQIVVRAAELHGWNALIYSPEMPVVPQYRDRLRKVIGGPVEDADAFIRQHICFLDHHPSREDDFNLDIPRIVEKTAEAVMRHGVKIVLLDPWNEIEHAKPRDMMMIDYIAEAIRALRRMALDHKLTVIVVAHPTKEVKSPKGEVRCPSLYDIEGAAHWFNKADHGIVVWRDPGGQHTEISISKVRFSPETGTTGAVRMRFDPARCIFVPLDNVVQASDLFTSGKVERYMTGYKEDDQ